MDYCCDAFKLMHTIHKCIEYRDFGKGIKPYLNVEVNDDIIYEINENKNVITKTTLLPMPLYYCPECGVKQ